MEGTLLTIKKPEDMLPEANMPSNVIPNVENVKLQIIGTDQQQALVYCQDSLAGDAGDVGDRVTPSQLRTLSLDQYQGVCAPLLAMVTTATPVVPACTAHQVAYQVQAGYPVQAAYGANAQTTYAVRNTSQAPLQTMPAYSSPCNTQGPFILNPLSQGPHRLQPIPKSTRVIVQLSDKSMRAVHVSPPPYQSGETANAPNATSSPWCSRNQLSGAQNSNPTVNAPPRMQSRSGVEIDAEEKNAGRVPGPSTPHPPKPYLDLLEHMDAPPSQAVALRRPPYSSLVVGDNAPSPAAAGPVPIQPRPRNPPIQPRILTSSNAAKGNMIRIQSSTGDVFAFPADLNADGALINGVPVVTGLTPNKASRPINIDILPALCGVCGDRASGVHYGVSSCEGCKSFFRRSLIEVGKSVKKKCYYNMTCNISHNTRNHCQFCRLQKCLKMGMSRRATKLGRRRHNEIVTNQKELEQTELACNGLLALKSSSNCENMLMENGDIVFIKRIPSEKSVEEQRENTKKMLLEAKSKPEKKKKSLRNERLQFAQLADDRKFSSDNLYSAYKSCFENSSNFQGIAATTGCFRMFMSYFKILYNRVTDFCSIIPDFVTLNQNDAQILVSVGSFEVMCLLATKLISNNVVRLVINDRVKSFTSKEISDDCLLEDKEAFDSFLVGLFEFVQKHSGLFYNQEDFSVLCTIAVCNPDRQNLVDSDAVLKLQKVLISLFRKPDMTNRIFHLATDARQLGITHGQTFLQTIEDLAVP